MALGSFAFGTFATARSYPGARAGLFVIGSGLTLLQTAANPYVAIIGPIDGATRRISAMGICNKVAGILSPTLLGGIVLRGIEGIERRLRQEPDAAVRDALLGELARRVEAPDLLMAALLALMALAVLRSPLPDLRASESNRGRTPPGARGSGLRQMPRLWLGAACLFLYVGAEVDRRRRDRHLWEGIPPADG
jgi:fucose permease